MNFTRFRHAALLAIATLAATAILQGEGPLYVGGLSSVPGKPFSWSHSSQAFNATTVTLSYWTDLGTLGTLTNTQANTLVANAFANWAGVATADINFSAAGQLPQDVTGSNVLTVLNALENCATLPSAPGGGAEPITIIYDTDGSVITTLGDDPSVVLGEATAACLTSDTTTYNTFNRGFAILNGFFSSQSNFSNLMTAVMTHEFGHLQGLDHSQINLDCLSSPCTTAQLDGVPIMFPVLLQNSSTGAFPTSPHVDDIAGISILYPETASTPPAGKTNFNTLGRIQGRVFFTDGVTQAQGFNVIARCVSCADGGVTTAVSNVSGYLFTEDAGNGAVAGSTTENPFGSRDQTLIGFYDIPGVPPGDYTVEVEAINDMGQFPFVFGSSVGPIGNLGFQFVLPGTCASQQFFNSPPPGAAPCSSGTPITVVATGTGNTISTGIDIDFIGTNPRFDAWED